MKDFSQGTQPLGVRSEPGIIRTSLMALYQLEHIPKLKNTLIYPFAVEISPKETNDT
jgi:hypothetical protein